ncbi:hypothetical protein VPNG_09688 [Cytospora leucostoma]|uniref:Uncharacterized protein n=1 Tax=Cytospora leucostoma TaxID=1230097 RepID=A0A423VJT9_9PEZI|nr:hypothetical protein VPNG_09688 [Cytospora leucostoma]
MAFVSFVPTPKCNRGTVDIIWSYLPTIFLSLGPVSTTRSPTLFSTVSSSLRELHDAPAFRRAVHQLAAPGWRSLTLRQAFLFLLGGLHFDDVSDYYTRDAYPRNADRFLAAAAACRFVLTLLSRLVGRLATSPLEFVTMSYVFCGLVMYIAWFHCPQGIEEPFAIAAKGIKPQTAHGPEVLSVQVEGVKWTSDMHKAVYGTTIFLAFTGVHF